MAISASATTGCGTGAGATVVAAMIDGATAHIAWAGDSRAYRLRDGGFDLLTHDHSLVQELVDAGLLTRRPRREPSAIARRHPRAGGRRRSPPADGQRPASSPATGCCSVRTACRARCRRTDATGDAIDALADRMLANALARDGSDNVSLVLVESATR